MADTDVLTLEAAKEVAYRSPSDTRDDALLQAVLSGLSNRLDRACGPIVRRDVTDEAHDGGCADITLRYEPVAAIATVTEWDHGTARVLTRETPAAPGDYLARPWPIPDPPGLLSARLERRTGRCGHRFATGDLNIIVAYTAGRYPTTEAVEGTRFAEAARIALGYLWRRRDLSLDADWSAMYPATMPKIVAEILGSDWREGWWVA